MENNFLITVTLMVAILLSLIGHFVMNVKPEGYNVYIMTGLIGLTITLISALIFYFTGRQRIGETPREAFRRALKKGALVGIIMTMGLAAQIRFDLI